jgi:tetratricopeptide (TPR) repeat protein
MANVLESQGKLEDAMELYRKALEIYKKTPGEEHPFVAMTYNNMARLCWEKIIQM